jgi:hypothetical protein
METGIRHLTDPRIMAAIEQNLAEEMAGFGRTLPGAELHQDKELTWFRMAPDAINGVLLTNIRTDNEAHIHTRIKEVIASFQAHQIPVISWSIGPATQPEMMADYLVSHGFVNRATSTCMALCIAERPPFQQPQTTSAQLEISEINDPDTLQRKCDIEEICFQTTPETARRYYQMYTQSGFGPGKKWHHYVGKSNGRIITIGSILLHAGIAGIFGVATLQDARHQGAATLLTKHLLEEIQRLEYHIAVLVPGNLSRSIYQKLGFHDFCHMHYYTLNIAKNNARE